MDISHYFKELLGPRFWGGALFLGWLIFFSYYMHISYLPDFDFFSLAHFLLAAAFVGAVLLLSISVVTLCPALMWRATVFGNKEYSKFEFELERSTSIMMWFAGPFFPIFIFCFFAFYVDFIGGYSSIVISLIVVGLVLSYLWLHLGLTKHGVTPRGRFYWWYIICWGVSWTTFIVPLGLIAIFVFASEQLISPNIGQIPQWTFFFLLSALAIFASAIALQQGVVKFENVAPKWRIDVQFMTVGGVFALVLFLIPGVWSLLPTIVMRNLGLGGDLPVRVVLNDDGWKVASAFGISPGDHADKSPAVALLLRSRLGSEFLFFNNNMQFSLPKSMVLGVLYEDTTKKKDAAK